MIDHVFTGAESWVAAVERDAEALSSSAPDLLPSALIAVVHAEASGVRSDGRTELTSDAIAHLTGLPPKTVRRARLALTDCQFEVLLEPAHASGAVRRQLQLPSHLHPPTL